MHVQSDKCIAFQKAHPVHQYISSSCISRAMMIFRWLQLHTMDRWWFKSAHEGQSHTLQLINYTNHFIWPYRSTLLPLLAMYPLRLSDASLHFWISAILHVTMPSHLTLLINFRMPLIVSIIIKTSLSTLLAWMGTSSHCPDNIHYFITLTHFAFLDLQMGFAPQLQN